MRPHFSKQDGFTLIEILIVIALLAILFVIALLVLNPTKQREKIWDVQRKREINTLKVLIDNYYFDNMRFPTGDELCFDEVVQNGNICSCHVCGLAEDNHIFGPLLHVLYCDPEHPKKEYLYQFDCSENPLWYRVYAQLAEDPSGGSSTQCNYGFSSDPKDVEPFPDLCSEEESEEEEEPPPACPEIGVYCFQGVQCNICSPLENCISGGRCNIPLQIYTDDLCTTPCRH